MLFSLAETWFKATEIPRRRPLFPPCLRELCPSPFLPVLQSPKSPSHPNLWMDIKSHQHLTLSQVYPKHKHHCPALFYPSKLQAGREPGEFGEGAMRSTREHPVNGEHWDVMGTPGLCLQPHLSRSNPCCDTEQDSPANLQARCQLPSL